MTVDISRLSDRLVKAHVTLSMHPETCALGNVIMMGRTEVVDYIPTAATDGLNCYYGAEFCAAQSDAQLRFIVLHEKGHIGFRHLLRHKDYWQEDRETANMAADYVVNAFIMSLNDKNLCAPPTVPMLFDPKYVGWSFGEVYRDLRQQQEEPQPEDDGDDEQEQDGDEESQGGGSGQENERGEPQDGEGESEGGARRPGEPKPGDGDKLGKPGQPFDYHDYDAVKEMGEGVREDISKKIAEAIEQGSTLAGKFGSSVPRVLADANTPKIDWTSALRDFVSTHATGKDDDLSLRRLNKRWLDMDIIMPSSISETVGEIVFGLDTSGSISDNEATTAINEVGALVRSVMPEKFRMLFWDHMVHGEQVYEQSQFDQIEKLLKPVGGGGTSASSVSKHLRENGGKPDCVVIMTDGYTEDKIDWDDMPPTLWIVTHNKDFNPPHGRVVFYHND
jgi:predicted metal-dependent peptidase